MCSTCICTPLLLIGVRTSTKILFLNQIKFTYCKVHRFEVYISWFSGYLQSCIIPITINIKHSCCSQKETLCPTAVNLHLPFSQILATTNLFGVFYISVYFYKQKHTISSTLLIAFSSGLFYFIAYFNAYFWEREER